MSTTSPPGTQQSLTDALQAAADAESQPTVREDRVVDEPLTCATEGCTRPAGADGQCTACRGETMGECIGSGGRRL